MAGTIAVPSGKVAEVWACGGGARSGRIGFELVHRDLRVTDGARKLPPRARKGVMSLGDPHRRLNMQGTHHIPQGTPCFSNRSRPRRQASLSACCPGVFPPKTSGHHPPGLQRSRRRAPESVSVLDMHGNLLSPGKRVPGDGSFEAALNASRGRARDPHQDQFHAGAASRRRAVDRAGVSADCDAFNAGGRAKLVQGRPSP